MRQTTAEFTVVGAWPKGITVGNWREGGCAAQSLIHSYSFISTTVDRSNYALSCLLRQPFAVARTDIPRKVVHGSTLCDPIQPNPSAAD